MSTIRCIYEKEPNFPATDQHPDAVRYVVGGKFVDAIGGQPTQAEVDAVLNPKKASDNATAMMTRQRSAAIEALDAAIVVLPPAQQQAFRLVQQLLKD